MPQNWVSAQAANVTTSTTVYNPTTSGVQSAVTGCYITNKTGSQVTANVTLNSGSVTTYVAYNIQIPAGYSLEVVQSDRINVPQNYILAVSATGAVDVTVSAIELT
jgi:hypothetical protein